MNISRLIRKTDNLNTSKFRQHGFICRRVIGENERHRDFPCKKRRRPALTQSYDLSKRLTGRPDARKGQLNGGLSKPHGKVWLPTVAAAVCLPPNTRGESSEAEFGRPQLVGLNYRVPVVPGVGPELPPPAPAATATARPRAKPPTIAAAEIPAPTVAPVAALAPAGAAVPLAGVGAGADCAYRTEERAAVRTAVPKRFILFDFT
jgi:hypothetical protein